jgi:hypothetical protein
MPVWPAAPTLLLVPAAQLLNLVLTFWGTLAVAWLAARWAPSLTLRKLILLLPLGRLVHDVCAGVPADNYALSAFAGTRWELGRFQLGFGWGNAHWGPSLELHLGALNGERWHSLSGGDLLAHALYYRGAWPVLVLLLVLALAVAAARLCARVVAFRRFGRVLAARAGDSRRGLRVGRAFVRRCADASWGGFTTGIVRPTVWLPKRSDGFGRAEIRAILQHELAHAARGDVALFALLAFVSDGLWFVPGIGWLVRRIHETCERAADLTAVRRGADPTALAHALVIAAEHRLGQVAGASAAGTTSTTQRVRALLAPSLQPTAAWRVALLTLWSATLAWVTLYSSFFGVR